MGKMNYTKGEWEVTYKRSPDKMLLATYIEPDIAALLLRGKQEEEVIANAQLIAEAINACIKLNPDNPLAVAQSISDLYEACKKLQAYFHKSFAEYFDETQEVPFVDGYRDMVLALAKAELKK